TRQDEAGGRAFWTASTAPSESDAASKQALAEVDRFMQARLKGDRGAAQESLDASGLNAYQGGASSLLSPAGSKYERYYPVTVQLRGVDGRPIITRITFDADSHPATLALSVRPGAYQLVVTTGVMDINGVTMADEYHASLVISR